MADEKEVETTGHQWDDEEGYPLKEYNNPLPKWWLYSYYATIVYAVVYWVLYPAWPIPGGEFTKGVLGWSQYKQLDEEMAAGVAARKPFNDKLAALTTAEITKDSQLLQYAVSAGKAIFGDNCAPCHGSGGVGSRAGGFPTLVDDDWLYGGTVEQISETIHGGRAGQMPAHLDSANGSFTAAQVDDLAQYTLSLSGSSTDSAAVGRGDALYHGDAGCNYCHGDSGKGALLGSAGGEKLDASIGAPNLTDGIWLYGGDAKTVRTSIANGRNGKMPAWATDTEGTNRKLDELEIKQLSIYVHTLGGGK
ncbi:MAG: cytochrome-c oxidase, cbb3-type subunit III [Magnetococcales bacterium]|nr:cytochrome-c oxidase, cbb3-type subunit III [Magnetococcales bacterium]